MRPETKNVAKDEKETVIIIGLLVIGIGIYSAYKLVEMYINPQNPVGLDQNTVWFINQWVVEYTSLYQELINYNPNNNQNNDINLYVRILTFDHDFTTKIANRPESTYALNEINRVWGTQFKSFNELFNFIRPIKDSFLT